MIRSASYLTFQFHYDARDSPFNLLLSPSQDSTAGRSYHLKLYDKSQNQVMDEHMCYRFDSFREVSLLMVKAYAMSVLLMALVLFWTAGDASLYFGYSYLDSRLYSRFSYRN